MRLTISILCLFISTFILFSGSVSAADYDFSLSTGYLKGDSTYQIGGHINMANGSQSTIHFPLSELAFPLDAVMLKAEVEATFADKWRLSLSGQTNITDDTGETEDSDWGVWNWSPASQLDIFSTTDTEMTALLFDGKLSYTFYQGYFGGSSIRKNSSNLLFSYSAALGYKHQLFDFEVSNLDQWYPSSPSTPHVRNSGLVGTYDVEYWIPYLELGMDVNKSDKYFFNLSVAYAPIMNAKDEDHHLLRGLVGISDHDWNGTAKFLTAKGRYNLNEHWFLGLEVEWMGIESEGRSVTYDNGVYDHTIDNEITSEQLSSFLTLGYSF